MRLLFFIFLCSLLLSCNKKTIHDSERLAVDAIDIAEDVVEEQSYGG